MDVLIPAFKIHFYDKDGEKVIKYLKTLKYFQKEASLKNKSLLQQEPTTPSKENNETTSFLNKNNSLNKEHPPISSTPISHEMKELSNPPLSTTGIVANFTNSTINNSTTYDIRTEFDQINMLLTPLQYRT